MPEKRKPDDRQHGQLEGNHHNQARDEFLIIHVSHPNLILHKTYKNHANLMENFTTYQNQPVRPKSRHPGIKMLIQ
jgi:hypothetical protein